MWGKPKTKGAAMAKTKRHTDPKYPGVYYTATTSASGDPDRIYYIRYRLDGKPIEEKAGRSSLNRMTFAKAARLRFRRLEGLDASNQARREAETEAKRAEADRYTISKLWTAYKAANPDLKGMTTDQNRFDNHIEPLFGKKEPSDLVPLDVNRLRLNLLKTLSPGTVKNILELLRRIINFGTKNQLCDGAGFQIKLPEVNNVRTEDLTPEQMARLLAVITEDEHPHAGAMMLLALYSGMRRGEMFRLEWRDINFEKGFIKLRDPKGGTDQTIPLNDAARALLDGHPRHKTSPFIFPGRGGKQRVDINKDVRRIKEAAGLPKGFRALHGLRHVYASMLASSGQVDLYTLQKLMTHKSPAMTQRYAHLRDETLRQASNLAGEIVSDMTRTAKLITLKK